MRSDWDSIKFTQQQRKHGQLEVYYQTVGFRLKSFFDRRNISYRENCRDDFSLLVDQAFNGICVPEFQNFAKYSAVLSAAVPAVLEREDRVRGVEANE
jgi:hypothetical protein